MRINHMVSPENTKRIVIPLEKPDWKKLRQLSLEYEISMNRIIQVAVKEIIKTFKKDVDKYR